MKFTYFTGLAIIPLAFALTEKEQLDVEDTSLDNSLRENAIIFEDGIGELAHSIAKDVDATLAMDAKQRGSDAPISIDSIIDLVFADKEDAHTTLGDGFHVSKDNLMREVMQEQKYIALEDAEKEEIVSDKEQKEATISEEDKHVLSSLHDEMMNGIRSFIMDSIKETKNGILGMTGQADISTIFTTFTNVRPVVETAFTGYGSGDSPIERIINIFESSVKDFNKKLLAVETDINKDIIQELADGQVETILTSLRTEIKPVVDQHVRFQDPPAEGGDGATAEPDFNVIGVIDNILQLVGGLIQYLVDSLLGLVSGFFNQNDPQGKFLKNGDMRLHLINTFERVADSYFSLIKGHVRATYFMMHVLTRAADTFNVFESYLGNLLTSKSMDGINNGLYVLLHDDVQLGKLTNALMRNVKPLSIQIATSLQSFATYNLNTLQETTPGRSFLFNPMDVVFNVLKSWTTDIKIKNGFLGVILETFIGAVETVFKEGDSGNFPLMPSLEEIIYTIESAIDIFISTSYLTALFL